MKKKIPLILTLACLCLVLAGVVGLTMSRRSSQPAASGGEVTAATAGRVGADVDMMMVRLPGGVKSQVKEYTGFTVSFNADNHTPNWVAWELLDSETDGPHKRSNNFWTDDEVEGCPDADDYRRSGYDKGHMCPAADQKWSEEAMSDCFSFANMVPQDGALNSGAWQTLEKKQRAWARRDSAIWIVAGPIYEKGDTSRIGKTGVRVPSAFFKVMAAPYVDVPRGIAFVYPNMTAPGNMENYVMTIDDVEQLTGYDFFYNLPDNQENMIESAASFHDWNRR